MHRIFGVTDVLRLRQVVTGIAPEGDGISPALRPPESIPVRAPGTSHVKDT